MREQCVSALSGMSGPDGPQRSHMQNQSSEALLTISQTCASGHKEEDRSKGSGYKLKCQTDSTVHEIQQSSFHAGRQRGPEWQR